MHWTNGLQKIFLTSFEGSGKTTQLTETFFEKLDKCVHYIFEASEQH